MITRLLPCATTAFRPTPTPTTAVRHRGAAQWMAPNGARRRFSAFAAPTTTSASSTSSSSSRLDAGASSSQHNQPIDSSPFSTTSASGSSSTSSELPVLRLDPLIVCGPSGVGKGSIIHQYMSGGGSQHFQFTVSHTTRLPRDGEIHGIHYHFVSHDEMQQLIQEQQTAHFLEYANVHGNWYGTSWHAMQTVQNSGKRCLLDIDVQGVKRIKQLSTSSTSLVIPQSNHDERSPFLQIELQPKYVFIAPPSIETLRHRLINRNSESEESLQKRLHNAQQELEYGLQDGQFDAIVINDDLEQAVHDFQSVIRQLYDQSDL